ncbi:Hsp70 family protein [Frankia sp. AgB32]|uniref:Hsp70 family protein n=1 Tax=Frankia sp. AgB32 TaxID=631119 RepID=UPI00200FD48D|nr:Hsp70 family protein [Frankia sp. AgB32]MCK9896348.1 Hsp70 family protein [Frankia sp. AgB32]
MPYGLGVDLGTTFTAVAVGLPADLTSTSAWPAADEAAGTARPPGGAGRPPVEMVSRGNQSVVTPTVAFADRDGRVLTGEAASRRAVSEPTRAARGFKRSLGDPTPLVLGDAPYSPAALLAATLADAVRVVTAVRGTPPAGVVLTRPAVWGPYRMEQFDAVPRLAGIGPVGLVTEPEAAVTHYTAARPLADGDVVAVYDLGGGTFDTAVLRAEGGQARILGMPEGVEWLGGLDFDEAVLHHVDQELDGALSALDPADGEAAVGLARLRQDVVLAKEALSFDEETSIPVFLPTARHAVRLTRAQFEDMVRPAIDTTVEALRRALRSAEVAPADLRAVLLAGGSSRIPLVARSVQAAFGRPTLVDTHPKHVVALGAARLAACLAGPTPAVRAPGGGRVAAGDPGRAGSATGGVPTGPTAAVPAPRPDRPEATDGLPGAARRAWRRHPVLLVTAAAVLGLLLAALAGGLYGYAHRSDAAAPPWPSPNLAAVPAAGGAGSGVRW